MIVKNLKLDKRLEWLRFYILDLIGIMPNLDLIRRIGVSYAKRSTRDLAAALCHMEDGLFTINLKMTHKSCDGLIKYTKMELISNFAHELAHVWVYHEKDSLWGEHTPNRVLVENIIMLIFMKRLEKEGYISEERENAQGKFYRHKNSNSSNRNRGLWKR